MIQRDPRSRARNWRRGRGVDGPRDDPYRAAAKMRGKFVCPTCRAVWARGRWTWSEAPADAREHECPACRRVRERQPAGWIRLEGDLGTHRGEVLALVRHREAAERAEHPLERIIDVKEEPFGLLITTTGIHVARRIAEALKRTWHEDVEIRYAKSQDLVRVTWRHAISQPAVRR